MSEGKRMMDASCHYDPLCMSFYEANRGGVIVLHLSVAMAYDMVPH
jgi:hypothetical protein